MAPYLHVAVARRHCGDAAAAQSLHAPRMCLNKQRRLGLTAQTIHYTSN